MTLIFDNTDIDTDVIYVLIVLFYIFVFISFGL